jgi:hypothetical protein
MSAPKAPLRCTTTKICDQPPALKTPLSLFNLEVSGSVSVSELYEYRAEENDTDTDPANKKPD